MTQIQELVEKALAASSADGCIVIAEEHSETNLRWAANNLTTNGQMRTRSVTVISTVDGAEGTSCGVVTRSVSNEDELESLVRAADKVARASAPAEDAAPIVENYPNDDDWTGEPAETNVGVFEQFAGTLGGVLEQWRKADRLLFGFAEHHMSSTYLGTSTGLRRRHDQPDGRIELNGKSVDYVRSAYANEHAPAFGAVDVAAMADRLEQRLDWASKRVDLEPGRYETIMPPTTIADLLVYAYWLGSARDAEEGRSAYSAGEGTTKVGTSLSPHPLHLYSDPGHTGIECAPFLVVPQSMAGVVSVFDNGVATGPVDWMRDGRLTALLANRAWAEQSTIEPRQFVDNLILDGGGTSDVDSMIANTERGLLLTTLWYIRIVDPQTMLLTGLTRDGVYLVENGAVSAAVNNFRFNESPLDLLARASEVGRTEHAMSREWSDYFRRSAMPPLRVPDFNMSTVSEAS
jgi:predicted Zn-dependent protease